MASGSGNSSNSNYHCPLRHGAGRNLAVVLLAARKRVKRRSRTCCRRRLGSTQEDAQLMTGGASETGGAIVSVSAIVTAGCHREAREAAPRCCDVPRLRQKVVAATAAGLGGAMANHHHLCVSAM